MPNTRLESDPELRPVARRIRQLSEKGLREFTMLVCYRGLAEAGISNEFANMALVCIGRGKSIPPDVLEELRTYANNTDRRYLSLLDAEGTPQSEIQLLFQKARVLSAIVMAAQSNFLDAAFESAYEVAVGTGHGISILEDALSAVTEGLS